MICGLYLNKAVTKKITFAKNILSAHYTRTFVCLDFFQLIQLF